jgi:SAM-dependent methyltransferase
MSAEARAERPAESSRCGLCGATGRAWRHKHGFEVLLCSSCGNGFVPESSVPKDLESLYSKAYFEGAHATGYPSYLADSSIILENFADRLRFIDEVGAPGKRLLDVGAAYGLFLKAARDAGWDASGVEIAPDCALEAARLSGASVACGDFCKVPLAGPYDVIVMLDVIEHFRDPAASVRRAFELLSPGGLLVIETGNLDAPWARLLGNRWYFLDPPQHLFYFSEQGLKALLDRSGFTSDVHLKREGRRVSTANISFKLAAGVPSGALRKVLTAASRAGVGGSVYINFGDGMLVAARRP